MVPEDTTAIPIITLPDLVLATGQIAQPDEHQNSEAPIRAIKTHSTVRELVGPIQYVSFSA